MKIATYNCNGVRARVDNIVRWLQKENPDILCMQEIKVETDLFPHKPFTELGYHAAVQGKKGHAGVATLSKIPPDKCVAGFSDGDNIENSRILACKFGSLHIINTYVPQGRDAEDEQFQYKLEWFRRFRNYLENNYSTRNKILWMGDFNVAPETIDVHNSKATMGHVCHRPEVFEALKNVREWGFVDIFRKFHKDEPGQYSWWDYRVRGTFERNVGWRVDHIYGTNSIAKKALKCWIDRDPRGWERPSDHTFVVVEFDL
ncbi:MAG: exodeoxyribonuclease III [bacterium]|nr:exodeoxyribonuclease III [bacterium]